MPKRQPNKVRLNDLNVKRLRQGQRPYLVWDTLQRGLAIQVQPSRSKAWKCIPASTYVNSPPSIAPVASWLVHRGRCMTLSRWISARPISAC